jgi:hypothetical protein
VYLEVDPQQVEDLKGYLKKLGILASIAARTRLMTHMDLPRGGIDAAVRAFREYPHWS